MASRFSTKKPSRSGPPVIDQEFVDGFDEKEPLPVISNTRPPVIEPVSASEQALHVAMESQELPEIKQDLQRVVILAVSPLSDRKYEALSKRFKVVRYCHEQFINKKVRDIAFDILHLPLDKKSREWVRSNFDDLKREQIILQSKDKDFAEQHGLPFDIANVVSELPIISDLMDPHEYIQFILSPEISLPVSTAVKFGKAVLGCLGKIC